MDKVEFRVERTGVTAELYCGDCLNILQALDEACVDAIVTDPPYGIDYHAGGKPKGNDARSTAQVLWNSIDNDDAPLGDWLSEAFRTLKNGGALYLCCRWDVELEWRGFIEEAEFLIKQRLIWHKRVHGKGDLKGTYATSCEDVIFASKGRHILNCRPSMLLDVGCVPTWEYRYHPHQKPIALPELLINTSTECLDIVLDPFMGSGTTGIACVQTGTVVHWH